jgi:hypothetical protein
MNIRPATIMRSVALTLALAVGAAGTCGAPLAASASPAPSASVPAKIRVAKSFTLGLLEHRRLSAKVVSAKGKTLTKKITYTSADPTIVTVTAKGVLHAKAAKGTTTVTLRTAKGTTARVTVKVRDYSRPTTFATKSAKASYGKTLGTKGNPYSAIVRYLLTHRNGASTASFRLGSDAPTPYPSSDPDAPLTFSGWSGDLGPMAETIRSLIANERLVDITVNYRARYVDFNWGSQGISTADSDLYYYFDRVRLTTKGWVSSNGMVLNNITVLTKHWVHDSYVGM